jgi:6-pyruvoyltetrahydropterin/6-carboxytetrahydropterin synthase
MGTFRISVSKDYLSFAAAHFITFRGHACESLHGHNYRVAIMIEGPIDPECHFVVDFAILKRTVQAMVDRIDHRVLLATSNPKLTFRVEGASTIVDYLGEVAYRFPTRDCAMLPIPNTTAEMLAEWLARDVSAGLREAGATFDLMEIEVEESPGQSAMYRERYQPPAR